jgi:hypothetical protein
MRACTPRHASVRAVAEPLCRVIAHGVSPVSRRVTPSSLAWTSVASNALSRPSAPANSVPNRLCTQSCISAMQLNL